MGEWGFYVLHVSHSITLAYAVDHAMSIRVPLLCQLIQGFFFGTML